MAEKETKNTNRLPTGMIKRANPLTLNASEEVTPEMKKPAKKKPVATTEKVSKPTNITLKGPKQLMFFLPLIDKALLSAIKTAFPALSNQALVEKALLTLLKETRPNAYDDLIKGIKK